MTTGKVSTAIDINDNSAGKALGFAERLLEYTTVTKDQKLLEVGCGNGALLRHLSQKYALKVTGTEIKPELVQVARQGSKNFPDVKIIGTTATNLPFKENEFDIVLAFMVIHQVPPWQRAMEEISRVVKPDGFIVIGDVFFSGLSLTLNRLLKKKSGFNELKELNSFIDAKGFATIYASKPAKYFEAVYQANK